MLFEWHGTYIPLKEAYRLANDSALTASLQSGQYFELFKVHGPSQDLNPNDNCALDYFQQCLSVLQELLSWSHIFAKDLLVFLTTIGAFAVRTSGHYKRGGVS